MRLQIAAALAAIHAAWPAAAQAPCAPHADVLAFLHESWSEGRIGMGLGNNGRVVELFVSEATGTWTIVATDAEGQACLLAAGQGWEAVDGGLPPSGMDG